MRVGYGAVPHPTLACITCEDEQHALHDTVDMGRMLAVARNTIEK